MSEWEAVAHVADVIGKIATDADGVWRHAWGVFGWAVAGWVIVMMTRSVIIFLLGYEKWLVEGGEEEVPGRFRRWR